MLAFSRKQVLQPKVINLNTIVENISKMITRVIGEDFELVISLDPQLGSIRADPGQIEQVILNLVVNAAQAITDVTPDGDVARPVAAVVVVGVPVVGVTGGTGVGPGVKR